MPSAMLNLDKSADAQSSAALSDKTTYYLNLWKSHIRGGFGTLPVVPESAQNHVVTDIDGKKYIDFLAQFAVMNFGYSHPKIIKATIDQIHKIPLAGSAYISPLYMQFAQRITKKFGYDCVATMLSGAEAADSAIKIARKWAYEKKLVPENEAWVLTCDQCYHGITLATMSLATEVPKVFGQHIPNVGPFAPTSGKLITYGNIDVLAETFAQDGDKIAAFMVEPVQGYAGTRFPPKGYLKGAQDLCKKYNILFICDEVQSGYGRTGKDLGYQHEEGVHPDIVTLGKAATAGFYPMSVIMGKGGVMDILGKYEVASTYGGSPIACAAALAALDILEEEQLSDRSQRLGVLLSQTLKKLNPPHILEYRGSALFQTLIIDESTPNVTARRVAALLAQRGVLVGSGSNRIRLTPPLIITEEAIVEAAGAIAQALHDVANLSDYPGAKFMN